MKQKIKIVGYPRTGNQFVITLIRYLTENQSNWKNLDDSWSGVWHSHDLRCEEKISRPIVYLCRDPITTIYSMSVANDRSAGTPIYRSSSDSENYVEFMKEYHKHLQKYYNKNNFIVKYRSIVESRSHRSRLGKTYSTPLSARVDTFQKMFDFLNLPHVKEGDLAEALATVNKKYVIEKISGPNPYYYNHHLLTNRYKQDRKRFSDKHETVFYEFYNDYKELFDEG